METYETYIYGKKKNLFLSFLIIGTLIMCLTQESYCFPLFKEHEEIIGALSKKAEHSVRNNYLNTKLASQDLQISILENLNRFRSKMINNNILNEDTILDLQELYNSISNNFVEFGSKIDGINKFTTDEISKINGDIVNSTSIMHKRANVLNKQSETFYRKSIASLNEKGIALNEKNMKHLKVAFAYFLVVNNIIIKIIIDNQERIINNLENVINHIRNIFGTIQ